MKAYVILRGFPGLGRVVAGLALMDHLKNKGGEFKIATYGRGLAAIKARDCCKFKISEEETNNGVSSIGIIPVSRFGEAIMSDIDSWNPDLILCDGEPLLIEAMGIIGLKNKVVSLVNEFDLFNPGNQYSSQKYFSYMYNQAGLILLHGLEIDRGMETDKCKTMNTIIRPEVINLGSRHIGNGSSKSNRIVGIIGGGIHKANKDFIESSIRIAEMFICLAKINKDKNFVLYCSGFGSDGNYIFEKKIPENILIIDKYVPPGEMYKNAELVVARAGRNTISELIFLKKKAVVIPTAKNDFRSGEQKKNIINAEKITNGNIIGFDSYCDVKALNILFLKQLDRQIYEYTWEPGNDKAAKEILKFAKKEIYDNYK